MKNDLKSIFKLIKKDWRRLFWFEMFYKIIFVVVIWPLCSLLWRGTLSLSGIGYVSIDRMTKAMFNPLIIAVMLLIGCIFVFVLIYEISVLMVSYKYSYYDKRLSFIQMIVLGGKKTLRIFKPHNIMIVIISVCILCIMNVTMESSIINSIKIPEYIQLYIDSNKMLKTVLNLFFFLLLVGNIAFIFVYNFFFCENERALSAVKKSVRITKRNFFKVLGNFFVVKFIISFVILVGLIGIILIYVLLLSAFLYNNAVVAFLWTLYEVCGPILGCIVTEVTVVIDYALITVMYYKYCDKEDISFARELNRKDYRLLALFEKAKGSFITIGIVISLLAVGVIFVVGYIIFDFNIYDEMYSPIEITAHRGNSTISVPNTIPAFQEAILEGADYGELDVRQTKDNVIVVTHDASLLEMTGKDINVRDVTYEQLQQIPCKVVNSKHCTVPKLEDVIETCKGKIKLNIEIKTGNNDSADFVPSVVKIIEDMDFVDDCVVTSLDYRALKQVKECNDNIKTGYIMAVAMGDFYELPCVDFFSMETTFVNGRVVERAHKLNKEVHVWTANSSESLKKCIDLGVDNIITDDVVGAKYSIATYGDDTFLMLLDEIKRDGKPIDDVNRLTEDATGIGEA